MRIDSVHVSIFRQPSFRLQIQATFNYVHLHPDYRLHKLHTLPGIILPLWHNILTYTGSFLAVYVNFAMLGCAPVIWRPSGVQFDMLPFFWATYWKSWQMRSQTVSACISLACWKCSNLVKSPLCSQAEKKLTLCDWTKFTQGYKILLAYYHSGYLLLCCPSQTCWKERDLEECLLDGHFTHYART